MGNCSDQTVFPKYKNEWLVVTLIHYERLCLNDEWGYKSEAKRIVKVYAEKIEGYQILQKKMTRILQ